MFYTNKTLEQKLKASMATSLHRAFYYYTTVRTIYIIYIFIYIYIRAVTIHQTHDSVRITIFDPRFGSYHDFFVGGEKEKKKRFLKQYFLLNNI